MIRTQNICKNFKNGNDILQVLKDITIELDTGLNILCGRSGSGKTTLMNILAGLDLPTQGKVWINHQDITELNSSALAKLRRKTIGFVFQSVALLGQMTAYQNVEFACRLAEYPAEKEEILAMLEFLGLRQKAGSLPSELSGGEQQRVAIARALIHRPKILFADEPTAQLDSASAAHIAQTFQKLALQNEICILMTTHDASILEYAGALWNIDNGQVIRG